MIYVVEDQHGLLLASNYSLQAYSHQKQNLEKSQTVIQIYTIIAKYIMHPSPYSTSNWLGK